MKIEILPSIFPFTFCFLLETEFHMTDTNMFYPTTALFNAHSMQNDESHFFKRFSSYLYIYWDTYTVKCCCTL